jgi:polar amino acid transport system ATP-binding protein
VLEIMASLAADGMTMVIVTHELDFARQCADRVIVMERGEIIEQGPTSQMFEAPRLQRTREILGLARSEARYKRFNFPNGPA